MVKHSNKSMIEDHERLERLFRAKKAKKVPVQQIRFKVLELYSTLQESSKDVPSLKLTLLRRSAGLLSKLALSKSVDEESGQRFLSNVLSFLSKNSASTENETDVWSEIIRNIFQILIYKNSKRCSNSLVSFVVFCSKQKRLEQLMKKHLPILLGYLRKGKEIDKLFFSVEKILLSSEVLFLASLNDLIDIFSTTKNSFFISHASSLFSKILQKGAESAIKLRQALTSKAKLVQTHIADNVKNVESKKSVENLFKFIAKPENKLTG